MRGREERPEAQPATVQGQGFRDQAAERGKMMEWRVATTDDSRTNLEQTRLRSNERGADGASLIPTKSHSARARPTAAPRTSPPWSVAEGFAAAADVLARQGEQPTGGYGTPKGAAGLARHVPGPVRNERPRADGVTGQTSDRR